MKKRVPWNKGKKGLQVAWNKGKKHSEATRKKLSKALKGRVPWNKGKKGVQVAWNKGLSVRLNPKGEFKKGDDRLIGNKFAKGNKPNKTSFVKGHLPHNKGTAGNSGTYASLHYWIKSIKGNPKKCEHCGTTNAKVYQWANIDHKYSKNPDDYIRLCVSCHLKYDYKFNGRKSSKKL
jgi:hypothetical protein